MRVTAALLLYVAFIGTIGASWLRRWDAPRMAFPRLGVVLWIALDLSVVLSLAFAAMAPVVGTQPIRDGLVSLLSACVLSLTQSYAGTGDATAHLGVAITGWLALSALTVLVAVGVIRAARFRRRHGEGVALLGRYSPELGAWIIEHTEPLAYCVSGKRRGIVVTSGALDVLDSRELAAVLAHETAHLRERHMQLVVFAEGLTRSLGWIPGVRAASEEFADLVELCADDAARRATDGRTVARALLALAAKPVPRGALGASASLTKVRLARLLDRPTKATLRSRLAPGGIVTAGLMAPVAIALLPAAFGLNADYCPADLAVTAQWSQSRVGVHAHEVNVDHHVVDDDARVSGDGNV